MKTHPYDSRRRLGGIAGFLFAIGCVIHPLVTMAVPGADPVLPPGAGTEADPYRISQMGHLVWMGDTVGASGGTYYELQNDLDASDTTNWNDGAGFAPIGNETTPFLGYFDGQGNVINGLTIFRPSQNCVGLIGFSAGGSVVEDLGLSGGAVTGASLVGGLAGYNAGTVRRCHAAKPVTGISSVGGLVGLNQYGALSNCYATGAVNGSGNYVGGLVGGNDQGSGTVNDCYARGSVTGTTYVGGLVGANSNGGRVNNAYATGWVTGASYVGGLAGYNDSDVNDSYWDMNTTGQAGSAGGQGLSTEEMKQQATFAGWDFLNVWQITEDVTYPLLAESTRIIGVSGSLAFGNVTVGQSATLTLTITNSGNAVLTVTEITYPTGFSGAWNGTIAAGGSQAVQVMFSPLTVDAYDGTVTVYSDKTSGESSIGASGTGVPVPQPGQICLSASSYSTQEGAKRQILVKRINGSSGTVSVTYVLKPKTALAGGDYVPKSGTLTWTNGQTAAKVLKIVIPVDGKVEGNELFQIVLKNPVGATLTVPSKATITILGNNKSEPGR